MDASPFIKLSPELRNIIYELCCRHDEVDAEESQLPMTRVCKQMRTESLLLSWSLPEAFVMEVSVGDIVNFSHSSWPQRQDRRNLDQIRKLRIYVNNTGYDEKHGGEWDMLCGALHDAGFNVSRIDLMLPKITHWDTSALPAAHLPGAFAALGQALQAGKNKLDRVLFMHKIQGWLEPEKAQVEHSVSRGGSEDGADDGGLELDEAAGEGATEAGEDEQK